MQACLQKLGVTLGGQGSQGVEASVAAAVSVAARRRERRQPPGVPAVPARVAAPVPHALHGAEPDAPPGAEPAADEHLDSAYTIGGVDQTSPSMGVVTTAQVTKGRFLAPAGGKEALVATSYAAKHSLKVGRSSNLNGTSFTVVGLVSPPLGGQSADVYLPLEQLQTLANEKSLANVILVHAKSSSDVARVKQEIQQALPQAQAGRRSELSS